MQWVQGSPTARKYSQLSSPATLGSTFSLCPSGTSDKTILNRFILAYPGGAPKKSKSKDLDFFIQTAGLVYHRCTKCSVYHQRRFAAFASHHALACILPASWWYTTLRVDDIQHFVLMICNTSCWWYTRLCRDFCELSFWVGFLRIMLSIVY